MCLVSVNYVINQGKNIGAWKHLKENEPASIYNTISLSEEIYEKAR